MTGIRQHCSTSQRRSRVEETNTVMPNGHRLNGIDFIEVIDRDAPPDMAQRLLDVTFLKPDGVGDLVKANVSVTGGSRITGLQVTAVAATAEAETVRLTLNAAGDFSTYTLTVHEPGKPDTDIPHMDARLSSVDFGFKVECPSDFDCKEDDPQGAALPPAPPIDYLTRDWQGFRQLMLDRMSVTMPGWSERNPADLGVTLVEALADATDKVSWMQDAIGTEAFFERTRYRQSLTRHARLLGYRAGEGQNARCAIALTVNANRLGPEPAIAKGTRFLTRPIAPGQAQDVALPRDPSVFESMINRGCLVFEAMHDLPTFRIKRSEMTLHNWGDEGCCLPTGSTAAWLVGETAELGLVNGDLLILEEKIPFDGAPKDPPDPTHRQLVRLSADPEPDSDPVFDLALTRIEWHAEDALRFALPMDEVGGEPSAVVRGNVLLADEGRTVDYAVPSEQAGEDTFAVGKPEDRGLLPDDGPGSAQRQRLDAGEVVRAARFDPEEALKHSARSAMRPTDTPVAAVSLTGEGERWTSVPDLLASDRFAPNVMIEAGTEDSATYIRFGDGVLGRAPGSLSKFKASIRHGGGTRGNIGAGAIAHIVSEDGDAIDAVENPLPAMGGAARQSRRSVQIAAPQAFREPRRAVTVQDYADVAAKHPSVARAYGRRAWTGSWYTITLAIDLVGGGEVDAGFESDLRDFIESHRLAGHDLRIVSPVFVPLDLIFYVCAKPDVYAADVTVDLLAVFSDRDLKGGTRGLFHPDVLDFGGDVALSPLIARAMAVPGVAWLGVRDTEGALAGRFGRMDQPGLDYSDAGSIPIAEGEIARLDNDRNRPEMGRVRFVTEGGR